MPFPILIDTDLRVCEAFGVAYDLSDDSIDLFKNVLSNDLSAVNAGKTWKLPNPARFVILPDVTIADAQVDPDYHYRPEPRDTIELLSELASRRDIVRAQQ